MSEGSRPEFYEVSVLRVSEETSDARAYTLDIPEGLREVFAHKAGQFLTFEIPWGDFSVRRSYSLASAVEFNEAPCVVVKRVDGGRVSNWFNDEVFAGSVLRVQPPAGRFVLKEGRAQAPLLLCAGGSGITPMLSLLKAALSGTRRRIKLIYANRDINSVIYKDELIRLQARYWDRVEVVHHLDSERGFMTSEDVAGMVVGWESGDAYICGPGPWMDVVESQLWASGFAKPAVHVERFVSPVDPDRMTPEMAAALAAAEAEAANSEASVVELTYGGFTVDLEVEPGETILQAALREGHAVEYQCEEGYCGCCMARLSDGEVSMALRDALSDQEIEDGWILACQARCKSKRVSVNYDSGF